MGCRQRDDRSRLLRLVADPGHAHPTVLVPDPAAGRPGRGAWLHLDPGCLDLAERRRAFGRALRLQGPVDASAVRNHVEQHRERQQQAVPPEHQPSSSEAGQQLMGTR